MPLYVRFLKASTGTLIGDAPTESVSINVGLNQSAEWGAKFSIAEPVLANVEEGMDVEIYWNGNFFLKGSIQSIEQSFEDASMLSIKGRDILDALFTYPADPNGLFVDTNILVILTSLLESSGWRLGDISTIEDKALAISIDLRDKSQLIEQIRAVMDNMPGTYFRYGGVIDGHHTIDVGRFGENSQFAYYSAPPQPNLLDASDNVGIINTFTIDSTTTEIVHKVEPFGGEVRVGGVDRTIHLGWAYEQDNSIVHHDTYPVRETMADARYTVYNRNIASYPGGEVVSYGATNTAQALVGEVASAADTYDWLLVKFVPVPGAFRGFSIWHSGYNVALPEEDLVWELYEATFITDHWERANSTIIESGSFYPDVSDDAEGYTYVPSVTKPVMEWDKDYCIVIHNFDQAGFSNQEYVEFKLTGDIPQRTFSYSRGRKAGTGGAWDYSSFTWTAFTTNSPNIAIYTDPIVEPPGIGTVQRWSEHSPAKNNSNATDAVRRQTAYAVWNHATAYLADHETKQTSYTLKAIGENFTPRVGDKIYVEGHAEGSVIDPFSSKITTKTVSISEFLYVDSYDLDINDEGLSISLKLRDGNTLPQEQVFSFLYDKTKTKEPPAGDKAVTPYTETLVSYDFTINGVLPESEMEDGRIGVLYTISTPTVSKKHFVIPCGVPFTTDGSRLDFEVVSWPTLIPRLITFNGQPAIDTPYVIRVAPPNRNWNITDSFDCRAYLVWK